MKKSDAFKRMEMFVKKVTAHSGKLTRKATHYGSYSGGPVTDLTHLNKTRGGLYHE